MSRYLLLLCLILPISFAEDHYITQNGDASSHPVSWFNNADNWNNAVAEDGKIGLGDTVFFQGEITSQIVVKGSGSPGHYITLDGSDADMNINLMSLNYWGGAVHIYGGHDYIKIQNFVIDGNIDPMSTQGGRAGITVFADKNGEKACEHIIVDNCDIRETSEGIYAIGNIWNMTVTRTRIQDMVGSCFKGVGYSGSSSKRRWITIGGAPDMGNEFKNCGINHDGIYGTSEYYKVASDVYIDQVYDLVISYNHLYSDRVGFGFSGAYINEFERILIEYNTIHDHTSNNVRGGMSLKGDQVPSWQADDIIIRYNHIYGYPIELPCTVSGSGNEKPCTPWGQVNEGITVSARSQGAFVYGNYVHDSGQGIMVTQTWDYTLNDPDEYMRDNHVFSNIVEDIERSGIVFTGSSHGFENSNVFNNLVINAGQNPGSTNDDRRWSALTTIMARYRINDFSIYNNVIVNSRVEPGDFIGLYNQEQDDLYIDHNHHYNEHGIPKVWFRDDAPTTWDNMPADYGQNDNEGDPKLNGFTISSSDSPLVDSGADLGEVIEIVMIQGREYPIRWGDALHPSTEWSTIPPNVVPANQDDFGSGWEKGPYVYAEDGCTPSWNCGTWSCSTCQLGTQSCNRVCVDQNQCGADRTEYDERTCGELIYEAKKGTAVIDGDISEFNNAENILIEVSTGTTGEFSFMWDDEYLYIAGDISDDQLNTQYTAKDSNLWSDDSMELMLDTLNDAGSRMNSNDYKIYVSATNTVTDTRIYDAAWDSGIESEIIKTGTINNNADVDSGYVLEARVPLENLRPVSAGDVWGMGLALNDKHETGKEHESWFPNPANDFNVPDQWGDIIFIETVCLDILDIISVIDEWKSGHVGLEHVIIQIQEWLVCK